MPFSVYLRCVSRERLLFLWDVFMLGVAVLNLLLVLFDLTYISLRPRYIQHAPGIAAWYDPYKGIEPHWTTESYQKLADSLALRWQKSGGTLSEAELAAFGDTLFALSAKILSERPYERFGLMAYQEQLKNKVKAFVQTHYGERLSGTAAFRRFWTLSPTNAALHLDFYRKELHYLLSVNYYRKYDLSGEYVDEFWRLDLPFLVFFWLEFWGAWFVSIRTRRYAYWWMYPVAHWYDVLALIPLRSLRWFRLLRIWSLYVRLNRSRVVNFSNTLVMRFLTQQSRLIAKAISNEVAFQILEQVKRDVARGDQLKQSAGVLAELRPVVRTLVAGEAGPLVGNLRRNPALLQLVEDSVAEGLARELPSIPGLPRERLLPLVRKVARQTTEKLLTHAEAYLSSEAGQTALESLTDSVLGHVAQRLESPELQAQLQKAIIAVLTRLQTNFRQLPPSVYAAQESL